MQLNSLIKPSKRVLVIMIIAIFASLSGNFGDVVLLNEEQVSPNLPKPYYDGVNSAVIIDGQIHAVYGMQSIVDAWKDQVIYARSFFDNGELQFQRIPLDDYYVPEYRYLTVVPEPVMTFTPGGGLTVIYPKTDFCHETHKRYQYLWQLSMDTDGNIISSDSLFSNVYSTSQLIADESKINLLFKEGAPPVNLGQFNQFSDIFKALDDVPGNIRYFQGDIVHGKVHSNTDIWIRQNSWPTFHGLVTTAGRVRVYPDGGTVFPADQIFIGGLIENHLPIELPESAREARMYGTYPFGSEPRDDMIAYVTVDGSSYESMKGQIVVEDYEDPDFEWTEGHNQFTVYDYYPPYGSLGDSIGTNWIPKVDTIWSQGTSGTVINQSVFVPMELWISGNFSGKQTWASSDDIYLKDDLTYTNTQHGLPPDGDYYNEYPVNETDYLGIISENSIHIQYGHKSPYDSVRYKPNTNDIYMYGSYYALGRGENTWQDGTLTYQYQFPKGSTPPQYIRGEWFRHIDLHRFKYPTTASEPWPLGLDYPWYNPLWPEPGEVYGLPHVRNPHNAPMIVKLRGDIWLYGSMAQRRVGYVRRSGNPDFDTGLWDIDNTIDPTSPPKYGAPAPAIGATGYSKIYHYDRRLDHTPPPNTPKGDFLNPRGRHFHYWTSDDGIDFTPVLSQELDCFDKSLTMAVHGSSVAILSDTTLFLFPDNDNEYEKIEINMAAEETVREMLYTEHGLYILATDFRKDQEDYLSKLYNYNLQSNTLTKIDEKILPDLMQTIHLFHEHILWAGAVDEQTVEIYKYHHSGAIRASVLWQHDIEKPELYSKELSTLTLQSEDKLVFITLNYRELYDGDPPLDFHLSLDRGGDIYTALGYFEFTAIEEDVETETLPPVSLKHFPNPLSKSELIAGKLMNIDFTLPVNSNVKIDIYNIRGQHIRSLTNDEYQKGKHSISWDGTDKKNNPVATGVYFYQMKTDDKVNSRKVLLLR